MHTQFNSLTRFAANLLSRAKNRLKRCNPTAGQDLIEYALMAGFVAVSAGAIMPPLAASISTIFSKIGSVLVLASNQGS